MIRKLSLTALAVSVAAALLAAVPASAQSGIDANATLRVAAPVAMSTLDPHRSTSNTNLEYLTLIYDRLVDQQGETLKIVPQLATSWSYTPDGKQLTMILRRGVFFGDGTEFTSASVRASLLRAKGVDGSIAAAELQNVSNVVAVDKYTARLILARPDTSLLVGLADHAGMMISEKAIAEKRNIATSDSGAGTGPFAVTAQSLPNSVSLTKRANAKYWDANAFRFRKITFYNTGDNNVVFNGMRNGNFDVAKANADTTTARQTAGPNVIIRKIPSNVIRTLHLRSTRGALQDASVREAIAQGVDWQGIATKVLDDRYAYADQNFRTTDPAYIPGFKPYAYRPNEVGNKLKGKTFSLVVSSALPDELKIVAVLQDTLQNYGAKVNVTKTTNAGAIADFAAGKYDMWVQAYGAKSDAALTMTDVFYGFEGLGGAEATGVQAAINKANALPLESKAREDALERMNRAIAQTYDLIPVGALDATWLIGKKVNGVDKFMNTTWGSSINPRYWTISK